jgi:hypothetical protein
MNTNRQGRPRRKHAGFEAEWPRTWMHRLP